MTEDRGLVVSGGAVGEHTLTWELSPTYIEDTTETVSTGMELASEGERAPHCCVVKMG